MDANLPVMAASSLSPTSFPWLSLITLLPAAVAPLLMLLPGDGTDPKLPRSIALATLLADLLLML
ncbi:MAG: NAD(P)H-quinone oxidoreductase subunit 4, partial [Vulcanococcus sp.]